MNINIKEEEKKARRMITRLSFICGDLDEIEKLEMRDREILEILDIISKKVLLLKEILIKRLGFVIYSKRQK